MPILLLKIPFQSLKSDGKMRKSDKPSTDPKSIKRHRLRVLREEWVYDLVESRRCLFQEQDQLVSSLKKTKFWLAKFQSKITYLESSKCRLLTEQAIYWGKKLLDLREKKRIFSATVRGRSLLCQSTATSQVTFLETEESIIFNGLAAEKDLQDECDKVGYSPILYPVVSKIIHCGSIM